IERDTVTDLDSLLSEERDAAIYSFVSTTDNLVRIQYDVSFQWAGYLNETTSTISADCKYILVGKYKDVQIAARR
ncbi:hypothetical protein LPJ71_005762, partial [Coemansia sp. S17]